MSTPARISLGLDNALLKSLGLSESLSENIMKARATEKATSITKEMSVVLNLALPPNHLVILLSIDLVGVKSIA